VKQLRSFIKKEFFHIFRDPRTMLILFGIPVTQLLIFGTVIKNEIKDVRIANYDQSKDETTQQIANKLLSSGYFILEKNLENTRDIEAIFREGNVKEVIVFENNFGEKLIKEGSAQVQLIADASDPNMARLMVSYTRGIMLKGVGMAFVWKETLILIGMTLIFVAVSVRKFKIRLE